MSTIELVDQDTSPEAQRRYYELLRRQGPLGRLQSVARLTNMVRQLALADINARNPNASAKERQSLLAERLYGREVAKRLFPGLLTNGG